MAQFSLNWIACLASKEQPRPVTAQILKSSQGRLEHILARLKPRESTLVAFSQPELRALVEALHAWHSRLTRQDGTQAGAAFKLYLRMTWRVHSYQ